MQVAKFDIDFNTTNYLINETIYRCNRLPNYHDKIKNIRAFPMEKKDLDFINRAISYWPIYRFEVSCIDPSQFFSCFVIQIYFTIDGEVQGYGFLMAKLIEQL